jgi:hypothetical protein
MFALHLCLLLIIIPHGCRILATKLPILFRKEVDKASKVLYNCRIDSARVSLDCKAGGGETMMTFKELFERQDKGLHPCRYPKCREYGNTADRKYGVVCKGHTS